MRRPQPYRFEYLRRCDGMFFVALRGPRGGGRAFPLTQADLIRLIDAYRASCGAAAARRAVAVTIYDAGISRCAVVGCGRATELLISMGPAPLGPGVWPSCIDHFVSVRSVFVRRGDRIDYGPGAPELIIKRAGDRPVVR